MASGGLQLLGFVLAFVGWIGIITSTILPQWKMLAYGQGGIVTYQSIYEGLWMSCAMYSTGQIQCKIFDSLLGLSSDMHATRALMMCGIFLGFVAILISMIGMKCMKCMEDDQVKKMRMAIFGGVVFIVSGLATLVASAMYGNKVIREFYDPYTPVNGRYEFGPAVFVAWAAAALVMLGGSFLCCSCPRRETSYPARGGYPKNVPSTGKDYV
ncbi:CLD1 protein, partial [Piaya cayana]|nr:CLD1 protein [Piaya cayana]